MRQVVWVFLLFLTWGCQGIKNEFQEPLDYDIDNNTEPDVNGLETDAGCIVMSNDVLRRAYQMANMEWIPVKRIPYRNGTFYEPGQKVKGVPYSSVKEINTYLFQDVSYHTFMTAVHNPNSVLYTEDISQVPYHGTNCAPYYGAVCSSSVMYALGFSIPYYANQIKDLPCMKKIEPQIIDSLTICDVMWKNGHVQMVFDLEYKADTLYQVTTFESSGMSAHLSTFSKDQFLEMWNRDGYVGYRYENLKYSEESPVLIEPDDIEYNDDLCPSKGDRAVYREDEGILINIFNKDYDWIVLEKDSVIIDKEQLNGEDFLFNDLSAGIYYVYLQKEAEKSSSVSFETIKTYVSVSSCEDESSIMINFDTTGKADYAVLCDRQGNSLYYPITEKERNNGKIVVPKREVAEVLCKVVFQGEYGTVINRPILVE